MSHYSRYRRVDLLRRVGGGYIFTHRLLIEHIAALSDAEISALSADRL